MNTHQFDAFINHLSDEFISAWHETSSQCFGYLIDDLFGYCAGCEL
jgi:hypothetical protein